MGWWCWVCFLARTTLFASLFSLVASTFCLPVYPFLHCTAALTRFAIARFSSTLLSLSLSFSLTSRLLCLSFSFLSASPLDCVSGARCTSVPLRRACVVRALPECRYVNHCLDTATCSIANNNAGTWFALLLLIQYFVWAYGAEWPLGVSEEAFEMYMSFGAALVVVNFLLVLV